MSEPVTVPVGQIRQRLDNDSADYVFSPDLYATLALAYDSMAAPSVTTGADGVDTPNFTSMQPRLAVDWGEEPDGSWLVRLRDGVRSEAGHEWNADDLVWVYDKARDQGVMASWRWYGVVGVTAVEVVDARTVRYRLRAPYPTFPNWLLSVSPNMVDATEVRSHATAADPFGIEWLAGHTAGYGAYVLESMDAHRLEFGARADHWGGRAEVGTVRVELAGDRDEAIASLGGRAPVVVVGLDVDEAVAQMRAGDDRRVVRTWAGHASVEIDFTAAPFDDVRVRRALAFATPYEEIRQRGFLGSARAWTSPAKGISQWYDTRPLPYSLDLARARRLLAEAGHADGLTSTLYADPRPSAVRTAELLRESWALVGVEVDVRVLSDEPADWLPPLWVRTECAHNLSEPLYDVVHDYAAMNPLLPLPGGPPHVGNWRPRWAANPPVVEQLVDVLLQPDRDRKRSDFLALQRRIVDESTSLFLAETQQTMVATASVPESFTATGTRFYQAMQLQNATSGYLPSRRSPGTRDEEG